jgi:hypothetical protein
MKRPDIIFLTVIICGLIYTSCDSQSPGEPPVWVNYYAFVDEEGKDFFDNNPDYSVENLRIGLSLDMEGNIQIGMLNEGYYYKVNGFNVFGTGPFIRQNQYWHFGNGDVDTLRNSWNPLSVTAENAYNLKSFEHIFNGKVIEKWDFTGSHTVKDWINGNNVGGDILLHERAEGRGFENIKIVYILKKPQPEEFADN